MKITLLHFIQKQRPVGRKRSNCEADPLARQCSTKVEPTQHAVTSAPSLVTATHIAAIHKPLAVIPAQAGIHKAMQAGTAHGFRLQATGMTRGSLQAGFTLLEMVLVLFLIGLMASATLMLTEGVEDQAKYDATKLRMEMMRKAIVGDPTRTVNGGPEISGFVADMGRLPNDVRELTEQAYCYTAGYATEPLCTAAGKTWFEVPSYTVFYQCSDDTYINETDCITNSETWGPNDASVAVGWNGPYIQVQPERDGSLKFRDGYGNSGDDSEGVNSDARNSGWDYDVSVALGTIGLSSEGFNASITTDDVNATDINEADWIVELSSSVGAAFTKPYDPSLLTNSRCSDPTKTSKTACDAASEIWYGGCEKAGYFNKSSCVASSETWVQLCSDGSSTDKVTCDIAGEAWYGEGYGCSDQKFTTKPYCEGASATWRSCSDDGTITDRTSCELNNEIWYGEDSFSIPLANYRVSNICMKIFYRLDESVSEAISSTVPVKEDGSHRTIPFEFSSTDIPIGINKIGIYEYDGTGCTDTFYPNDRTNEIDVVFRARTQLGVINW